MSIRAQEYEQRAWRTTHQETKLHDGHHQVQSIEKTPSQSSSSGGSVKVIPGEQLQARHKEVLVVELRTCPT